ncbi:MAG: efflux RND transporter periplasmic adaptor subunit [Deltaproteobacteria bacterium]|nr:efflux RND transporter periplasmic adaptor subunit [Deltaproteobacteria bacterium]
MQFRIKPNRITKSLFLFILACVFLLGSCNNGHQTQPSPPPPEVVTVTVKEQPVVLTTELTGRTSPYQVAEVRPQVSGIIQKRLFSEGADIKAGTVLYQIDPAPLQAALDSARAALSRSEANLSAIRLKADRVRELVADKAVSQQDYDDAMAALKQTEADVQYWKAAVETSRINLKYASITAPISGRIGKSNVTVGALVAAYQPIPLATVQQLDPIYVDVSQSTAELLRLKRRTEGGHLDQNGTDQKKVKLILDDGTSYPLEGTLQFRDVTVDPSTGTVTLRAVFSNPEGVLLPGMFVRAVVQEGVNNKAILVPQQAVSRDPKGNPFTLIVDAEGKVQQRQITIDRAIGDQWLITSGLAAGERVIIEGIQKVRPGAPAKAVSSGEGETNRPAAEHEALPAAHTN